MEARLAERPVMGRGLGLKGSREATGRVGKAVVPWWPAESTPIQYPQWPDVPEVRSGHAADRSRITNSKPRSLFGGISTENWNGRYGSCQGLGIGP